MESETEIRYKAFVRPRSHAVVTATCIVATVALLWRYVASVFVGPDHVFVTTPEVQVAWMPPFLLTFLIIKWGREALEERQSAIHGPPQSH